MSHSGKENSVFMDSPVTVRVYTFIFLKHNFHASRKHELLHN